MNDAPLILTEPEARALALLMEFPLEYLMEFVPNE